MIKPLKIKIGLIILRNSSFVILCFLTTFLLNVTYISPQDLQESHLSANLPDTYEEFLKIVNRDLTNFFSKYSKKNIELKFDLLRKEPTQSGLAYPKFYLWVVFKNNDKIIDQGAVRIAAIEKTHIDVTDFISKNEIIKNPTVIEAIFPKVLCNEINKRAGVH